MSSAAGSGPDQQSRSAGPREPDPVAARPGGGEPSLPKSIELMWGLAPAGTRGPRRGLSLDQIVDTAIELADESGFAALSMNKVAERLGFTAMSLYRYVDSKATLLEIAFDRVVGTPPSIAAGTPWRDALQQWAREEYRLISRHPGWLGAPMSAPPLGPNNMAWLEAGLAALGQTRVPEPRKLQLVMNLSLYVIGRARLAAEIRPGDEESDGDWAIIDRVLDPDRFPALTAAVRAQAFEQDQESWGDLFFDNGLTLLLDGYERLIASYE